MSMFVLKQFTLIHYTYYISIRSVGYSTAVFRRRQRRSKTKEKSRKGSKMNTGLILILMVQSLYGKLQYIIKLIH